MPVEIVEVGDEHVKETGEFRIFDKNDLDNGFSSDGSKYPYDHVAEDVFRWLGEQVPEAAFHRFFTVNHPQMLSVTWVLWYGTNGKVLRLQASGALRNGGGVMRAQLRKFFAGADDPVHITYPGYDIRQNAQKPSPFGEPVPLRVQHWFVRPEFAHEYPHTIPATGEPKYRLMHPVLNKPYWFMVVYISRPGGFPGFGGTSSPQKAFVQLNSAN